MINPPKEEEEEDIAKKMSAVKKKKKKKKKKATKKSKKDADTSGEESDSSSSTSSCSSNSSSSPEEQSSSSSEEVEEKKKARGKKRKKKSSKKKKKSSKKKKKRRSSSASLKRKEMEKLLKKNKTLLDLLIENQKEDMVENLLVRKPCDTKRVVIKPQETSLVEVFGDGTKGDVEEGNAEPEVKKSSERKRSCRSRSSSSSERKVILQQKPPAQSSSSIEVKINIVSDKNDVREVSATPSPPRQHSAGDRDNTRRDLSSRSLKALKKPASDAFEEEEVKSIEDVGKAHISQKHFKHSPMGDENLKKNENSDTRQLVEDPEPDGSNSVPS